MPWGEISFSSLVHFSWFQALEIEKQMELELNKIELVDLILLDMIITFGLQSPGRLKLLTNTFYFYFVSPYSDQLCFAVEAKSGFEIAFNMFDIDGNQKVDVDEFKVVR